MSNFTSPLDEARDLVARSRTVMETVHRYASDAGVSVNQYAAMSYLEEAPIPMTELGRRLGTTSAAVTGLVDRLEKTEMVERTAHAGDRRVSILSLTAKGRGVLTGCAEAVRKTMTAQA